MRSLFHWLAAAVFFSGASEAAEIAAESFDYAPASPLTGKAGGNGWSGVWSQDGESAVIGGTGLTFTDSLGNVLDVSGLAVDTAGIATTRSVRDFGSSRNDVWISMLFRLPGTNNKFEGVTFARGAQQVFTISNPSNTTGPGIFLVSNLAGGGSANSGMGAFGQTHLIVLKMTKGGGTGGADRVEAFIDPMLTGVPTIPDATINGANFDFDRVRIAGQDGSSLLVDELRVGDTFGDVTPHAAGGSEDSDNDGLTDSQERYLGTDPFVSDAGLIAGIQAHPDWFDLLSAPQILAQDSGGVVLEQTADDPVNLVFEVQHTENLSLWQTLETFTRRIELPSGKNFLRVSLQD
ncbi:MAG: hypothetical protein EOP88_04530 [Verrucomicrobiaceae bacterium]|nr:MAG: hypothetical protein EOP88_04530 [Verrucomicrobiaceae bacterium]